MDWLFFLQKKKSYYFQFVIIKLPFLTFVNERKYANAVFGKNLFLGYGHYNIILKISASLKELFFCLHICHGHALTHINDLFFWDTLYSRNRKYRIAYTTSETILIGNSPPPHNCGALIYCRCWLSSLTLLGASFIGPHLGFSTWLELPFSFISSFLFSSRLQIPFPFFFLPQFL